MNKYQSMLRGGLAVTELCQFAWGGHTEIGAKQRFYGFVDPYRSFSFFSAIAALLAFTFSALFFLSSNFASFSITRSFLLFSAALDKKIGFE